MEPSRFTVEARPHIPDSLNRLQDLANDLLYSWDHGVRGIFARLDLELWERVRHNPKIFLRRISQKRLNQAAEDRAYMADFHRVISSYDAYLSANPDPEILELLPAESELVAYFCAEFGLHESFPIYSGGLGILAGDHCKAASDLGLPFVGVGLLYQQGYFVQTIDAEGRQVADYHTHSSDELPITPLEDQDGRPMMVEIPFPNRTVLARLWEARAGHIRLYLLDTRVRENTPADQNITLQLYGGNEETRIQQELVLGVGGTRALGKLGLKPTAWHINEGHAAFQILERCRIAMETGLNFPSALETVAGTTLFTTHTPVPAGHDIFARTLIEDYLAVFAKSLETDTETLFSLGATPVGDSFNMTTLGLKGSRFHNGVSRIHGSVASEMEGGIWPQIPPKDNPLTYITNGVHVPTFLAPEWASLFNIQAPTWRSELRRPSFWEFVDAIPDYHYWGIHQALKQQLFDFMHLRLSRQHKRNGTSTSVAERMLETLSAPDRDCLVIGFARRFATYKRATLLFSDLERLERLLNNSDRPVMLVFAGKAHPKDKPGQQLIKVIHDLTMRPAFLGRLLLLEDYDQAMARRLVSGVDVWLNTPEYPKEASGTSGEKAAINGALNLSVLDGWWGEGYDGTNGWAIAPRHLSHDEDFRNREEANDLLDILEHQVVPLYYNRSSRDYSKGWIQRSKASMKTILPRFNAQRMVTDYVRNFYRPATLQHKRLTANEGQLARQLAEWKKQVRNEWQGVSLTLASDVPHQCHHDDQLHVRLEANLNGLSAEDVKVECLITQMAEDGEERSEPYIAELKIEDSNGPHPVFSLSQKPPFPGEQTLRFRMYPYHSALCHPLELGFMVWA
ncbi:alpha-glucan family phosphorylase [Marinimicrobium sp. ABcell2]|uniref:alpha-glucan family phosphorylase n=1 Tax=Marinimicrobium sp. ABcell2 TaxID=3069751 RepID=UPI0027B51906|nr:alpha-glucan family phosphorylase [Marinimicrobium sp. ABcell2]MDQ2075309.1 alpha-glucan family phosphorylase [Marinimicrobium sp. ABcell2]